MANNEVDKKKKSKVFLGITILFLVVTIVFGIIYFRISTDTSVNLDYEFSKNKYESLKNIHSKLGGLESETLKEAEKEYEKLEKQENERKLKYNVYKYIFFISCGITVVSLVSMSIFKIKENHNKDKN